MQVSLLWPCQVPGWFSVFVIISTIGFWTEAARVVKAGLKICAHLCEWCIQKARGWATWSTPVCIYIPRSTYIDIYTLCVYTCMVNIYIPSVHPHSYPLCREAYKNIKGNRKDLCTLCNGDYWLVHSVLDGDSMIAWDVPCRFLNRRLQNQFCGNWLDVTSLQTQHGCQEANSSCTITVFFCFFFKYQRWVKPPGWGSHNIEQRLMILASFHLQGDKFVHNKHHTMAGGARLRWSSQLS